MTYYHPQAEVGAVLEPSSSSRPKRLRLRYPKIMVAPLLYKVEDTRLYLIRERLS